MLNRIYIVVGLLAIIVLAGAFIVPRFIQWGDYRGRMEELATNVLGTSVTIRGDIEFSLLPQPRLTFTNVLVGSTEAPAATVDAVEAEFSLMDFLRDDYNVTRLLLRAPVVDFTIDESGFLGSGVSVAGTDGGVRLGETTVVDATVRLLDRRTGETYTAADVDGDLRLTSLAGPFQFQGAATVAQARYGIRLNSSALDATGISRVSASLRQDTGGISLTAEGAFTPGMAPKFDGALTYRQSPPAAEAAEDIRGDLVFESPVTASTDRIVLSGYTLQPDENRAGTRLTGAASIQLGERRGFDAVVSGGVFSLPPRDANEDSASQPYELVRLLSELPAPPLPPLPGRVGVDLAEIGARAFALRDVRMDASSDGSSWQIQHFTATLPGDTVVEASGALTADGDAASFEGKIAIDSQRLDALAALWRKPGEDTPLFNMPGRLQGRVMLASDALGLIDGLFTLEGVTHALEARIGFGEERRLDLVAQFDTLTPLASAAVGALLPNAATDPGFGLSFPDGSLAISAKSARMLGLDGTDLLAEGQWTPDAMTFSRLSAADWGGLGFDAAISVGGTLAEPEIAGSGRIGASSAAAPALALAYDALGTPAGWQEFLGRSMPAELLFDIAAADAEGVQVVTLEGAAGAGTLNLRASLSGGLGGMLTEPLRLTMTLEGEDATALGRQVGLGSAGLFSSDAPMLVSLGLEGAPPADLNAQLTASQGEESVSFSGDLAFVDDEIAGAGRLVVAVEDASGVAEFLGGPATNLPAVAGSAQLEFEGGRALRLTDISGSSGETGFSGALSLNRTATAATVDGELALDAISIEGLAEVLFGRGALVEGADLWPEGPIDLAGNSTRGVVAVAAPTLTGGGVSRLNDVGFELSWDDTRLRLGRFEGGFTGGGTANLDMTICCAGALVDKTVSGRVTLTDTRIDTVATPALAGMLDGTLSGGLQFEGTGGSVADILGGLAGEGSVVLEGLTVAQLTPLVFPTVAGLGDVLEMEPDALEAIIGLSLGQGEFTAPEATAAFTIAGGVLRLANFIVEGDGGRLAGSLNATLRTLGLEGGFVLTPRGFVDEAGLVGEDTSRIITRIAGTVMEPDVTLDLEEMVAAIQVRANELEVERLEVLRAEDAERQRAAAEERNRLIEEQRRRAAEEAARLAAEEAARAAEEDATDDLEMQGPPLPGSPPPQQQGPFTFTLPPPQVNQPASPGVNQPFFTPLN